MDRGSTLFLRSVLGLIALVVLSILLVGLPLLITRELVEDFDYAPLMIGLYLPAIPFFYALYQAYKLLNYIDENKAFSELSVDAFKKIKFCALSISGVFTLSLPYVFYLADMDDAPGLVAIGLVIVFASFVIGAFAAVLQKLIQNAVEIKSENDLTV